MKSEDKWLADYTYTSADVAESAYNTARSAHHGQRPQHMRTPWHLLKGSYQDMLIFMVDHALRAK